MEEASRRTRESERVERPDVARVLLAVADRQFGRSLARDFEQDPSVELIGVCQTARDALRSVRDLWPDVLLVDWDLPDSDAFFLLKQLKQQDIRTVLLIRGVGRPELTEAVSLGAAGALDRAVDPQIMVRCLHAVLDGEFWFQRDLTRALLASMPEQAEERGHPREAGSRLTPRERDVMRGVARGKTNREIAEELKVSEYTVKQHLKQVFGKLRVSSRVELVLRIARSDFHILSPRRSEVPHGRRGPERSSLAVGPTEALE
jgi:two-component system nitrate/nitrite response regulator NarL